MGCNGSGKSTVLEALELIWAGTSQRRPAGVSADEYAEHLPRRGRGDFVVRSGNVEITSIAETARAGLARAVLTQETVATLVDSAPGERYEALLALTGLKVPDLEPRTRDLLNRAKNAADNALRDAGLPTLPRADSRGLDHLRRELQGRFAERLPPFEELGAADAALAAASGGTYPGRDWGAEADRLVGTLLDECPRREDR